MQERRTSLLPDKGGAVHVVGGERAQQDGARPAALRRHMLPAEGDVGLRQHPQLPLVAPPGVRVLEGQRGVGLQQVQVVALEGREIRIISCRCKHPRMVPQQPCRGVDFYSGMLSCLTCIDATSKCFEMRHFAHIPVTMHARTPNALKTAAAYAAAPPCMTPALLR